MTEDDARKIMIIIAIALVYRNFSDGITTPCENLWEEEAEILTKHFNVKVTSNKEVKSEESL